MSNLYRPYHPNLTRTLASDYAPISGEAAAMISAELHDTSDNNWAHKHTLVGTISGTVSIAGEIIEGARVVLMSENDDIPVAYALTGADGKFLFNSLNVNTKFYVLVKLPSGWQNWEYMVSSRRNPA